MYPRLRINNEIGTSGQSCGAATTHSPPRAPSGPIPSRRRPRGRPCGFEPARDGVSRLDQFSAAGPLPCAAQAAWAAVSRRSTASRKGPLPASSREWSAKASSGPRGNRRRNRRASRFSGRGLQTRVDCLRGALAHRGERMLPESEPDRTTQCRDGKIGIVRGAPFPRFAGAHEYLGHQFVADVFQRNPVTLPGLNDRRRH